VGARFAVSRARQSRIPDGSIDFVTSSGVDNIDRERWALIRVMQALDELSAAGWKLLSTGRALGEDDAEVYRLRRPKKTARRLG
jgi:hypothetical protein